MNMEQRARQYDEIQKFEGLLAYAVVSHTEKKRKKIASAPSW